MRWALQREFVGSSGFSSAPRLAWAPRASGGGSWGLRVGAEFSKWFAVDAHYIVAQQQYAPSGAIHLFTNAAMAELQFTLPIRGGCFPILKSDSSASEPIRSPSIGRTT